jgi:hypothetical protein
MGSFAPSAQVPTVRRISLSPIHVVQTSTNPAPQPSQPHARSPSPFGGVGRLVPLRERTRLSPIFQNCASKSPLP